MCFHVYVFFLHVFIVTRAMQLVASLNKKKCINPLTPRRTLVSTFTEISILFLEGIIKKNFLWASRLWVGRRKEPILGYVPKNDEKKN